MPSADLEVRAGQGGVDDLVTHVGGRNLRPGHRPPPEMELARVLGAGQAKMLEVLTA
jgi:hypothetical protein